MDRSTTIAADGVPLPPHRGTPENLRTGAAPLPPEVYAQRVTIALALYHQKFSTADIAALMQVTPSTVRTWFRRARAENLLAEDLNTILDKDTVYRALEVLHEKLDDGNLEASLAVLKGRGHFRNYTNSNVDTHAAPTAIQVIYTTPSGGEPPKLTDVATLPGQIVGRGRTEAAASEAS